jgi:hypothetical protein
VHDGDAPLQVAVPRRLAVDLGDRHGGDMRIGRLIIIPAILTLGIAGSSLAAAAAPASAAQASHFHALKHELVYTGVYCHT